MKKYILPLTLASLFVSQAFGVAFTYGSGWSYSDGLGSDVGAATPTNPMGIVVSGLSGPITDVNVTITGLSSTYDGDLLFVLQSPTGTYGGLMLTPNSEEITFDSLTFDMSGDFYDSMTVSSGDHTVQPIFDSSYSTVNDAGPDPVLPSAILNLTVSDFDLTVFDGESANGTWNLFAYDIWGGDIASATGWSIDIEAVPEPSVAVTVFGLFALGMATLRRRVRR